MAFISNNEELSPAVQPARMMEGAVDMPLHELVSAVTHFTTQDIVASRKLVSPTAPAHPQPR